MTKSFIIKYVAPLSQNLLNFISVRNVLNITEDGRKYMLETISAIDEKFNNCFKSVVQHWTLIKANVEDLSQRKLADDRLLLQQIDGIKFEDNKLIVVLPNEEEKEEEKYDTIDDEEIALMDIYMLVIIMN